MTLSHQVQSLHLCSRVKSEVGWLEYHHFPETEAQEREGTVALFTATAPFTSSVLPPGTGCQCW